MIRGVGNALIAAMLAAWFLLDFFLGSERAEKIIDWVDGLFE